MGNKGWWEYLPAIYERYQKADRKGKKVILSEVCANTGYKRKYALRLWNGPRPRSAGYQPETVAVLRPVWEAPIDPWRGPTHGVA